VLVLSAAPGAGRAAANVRVVGTATLHTDGKEQKLSRAATPLQEVYFPGGGRGVFPVSLQTVAITDTSDILEVQLSRDEVVLKPGQEVRIEVAVKRRPGFAGGVSLDVMLRHLGRVYGSPLPPGVTLVEGKSKTLLGGGSKGHVVLRAAPGAAPVEGVPISVLAHVSINFVVKVSHASAPLRLSVRR
jgi:hypothetical protein